MAIDPSIYAQLGANVTPIANPLTQLGQVAQAGNALLGMQNAQRQMAAQQATGQNLQAATNPTTGAIDIGKLNVLNAQTPAAAYGAQGAAAANQSLAQAQQTRSMQAQQNINQALTSALTLPDDQMTPATLQSSLDQLKANGSITAQNEQAFLGGIPANATPVQIRQLLMQHTVANLAGPQALQQIYGSNSEQNQGGQLLSGVTAPASQGGGFTARTGTPLVPGPQIIGTGAASVPTVGGVPMAPAIPNALSPGEATAPTQIGIDPKTGAPIYGTRQQFIDKTAPSPLGTGRLPPALRNPNAAAPVVPGSIGAGSPGYAPPQGDVGAPPVAAVPTAPATPGVPMALGPAQQAALAAQGADSAKAFQDIADQGVQARGQAAILGNMLGDTAGFTSGQPALNAWKSSILKYTPPSVASSLGITPNSVASQESFDKWANQIASQQGAGTDARLAVSQHGSPNSSMSQGGVDLVLRQLQGNADYTQARQQLAASYPDQTNRAGFEAQIGTHLDPRAFQFERMTPQQKTAYVGSLTPQDRKALQSSYNWAASQGILGANQGSPSGQ